MTARTNSDLSGLNERYRRPLIAFFMRHRVGRSDAEDMTQEVFLRLMSSAIGELRSPDAYIFQVAANLLRNKMSTLRHRATQAEAMYLALDDRADFVDPQRLLSGREELARIVLALKELPERTREIFILDRLDSVPQLDIAKAYGISVRAVQKHIVKALSHLTLTAGREHDRHV